jgi:hypothetical protein
MGRKARVPKRLHADEFRASETFSRKAMPRIIPKASAAPMLRA